MNLSDQVVSLELSKRLRDLGIKQESLFCYQPIKNNEPSVWPRNFNLDEFAHPSEDERLAAFTCAELLELLPQWINIGKDEPFNNFRFRLERAHLCKDNTIESLSSHFICNYYCDSTEFAGENAWLQRKLIVQNFYDENLANCLAKLFIYLLENGLIKNG